MSISPVKVDFSLLASKDYCIELQDSFERAFGLHGFGAMIVTNIPNFKHIQQTVLYSMYKLSKEPQEVLDKLRQPNKDSLYEVGWHTKKMNAAFGKSSNRFVSFFSRYPGDTVVFPQDPEFEKESCNIWPSTIENFQEYILKLNECLVLPILGLLKYLDKYLAGNIKNYQKDKFVKSFSNAYSNANRLITYTPLDEFELQEEDRYNWDNWHTDFGLFATALHPIYLTKEGEIFNLGATCLYIRDRYGNEHELNFAEDEFAITTSDAMFIESAGYIPATPHTVKVKKEMPRNLYRCQAVSFFEPNLDYKMDIPTKESFREIIERDPMKYDHRGVDDFKQGMIYKEFIDELLQFLYK